MDPTSISRANLAMVLDIALAAEMAEIDSMHHQNHWDDITPTEGEGKSVTRVGKSLKPPKVKESLQENRRVNGTGVEGSIKFHT